MKKSCKINPALGLGAQLVLIMTWLTNLQKSDSYHFVYVMMAVFGALCLWDNYHNPAKSSRVHLLAGGVAALFSLSTVGANYFLFENLRSLMTLFDLACSLTGGFLIGYHVLRCLASRLPVTARPEEGKNRIKDSTVFWCCFASVVLVDLAYLVFVVWPGTLTSDSMLQVYQIHTGEYNNWHPFWHTQIIRLCIAVGKLVLGGYQGGVGLFLILQIFTLAFCISYGVVTLYQQKFPKWCVLLVWAAYVLLPYHIAYSASMWKDVFFGAACLVMVTSLYRLFAGQAKTRKRDTVIFALSSLCFCIWRSNGLPAYLLLFAVVLVFGKMERKLLAVMAGALVCGYLMTGPVLNALGVSGGNYVEALSIPLQQVARVIHDGGELTQEELALVEKVADPEAIRQEYRPEISDPIKNLVREGHARNEIRDNPVPYLKLWAQMGLRNPGEYLKAWVDQTKGYWNGGYAYWVWTESMFWNELGIHSAPLGGVVEKLFDLYFRYFEMIPFLKPFISIGANVWLMAACCYVNLKNKRKEWILTLPILAIVMSLLISTPVYSEFRYIYSLFLCAPVILSVTCFRRAE